MTNIEESGKPAPKLKEIVHYRTQIEIVIVQHWQFQRIVNYSIPDHFENIPNYP